MPTRVTVAHSTNLLEKTARNIKRLTEWSLRKGRAIPYGVLTPPTPNTTIGRTPDPFTGGN